MSRENAPECCEQKARFTTGAEVYPHRPDLAELNFYLCDICGASVGCHRAGTWHNDRIHTGDEPLGIMADRELRQWRLRMHRLFDPIWKKYRMTRRQAYAALADKLEINVDDCHISHFTKEQMPKVQAAVEELREELEMGASE